MVSRYALTFLFSALIVGYLDLVLKFGSLWTPLVALPFTIIYAFKPLMLGIALAFVAGLPIWFLVRATASRLGLPGWLGAALAAWPAAWAAGWGVALYARQGAPSDFAHPIEPSEYYLYLVAIVTPLTAWAFHIHE